MAAFWSSADLTGNQTVGRADGVVVAFWSSADLTGNQTPPAKRNKLFGVLEQCRSNW